MNKSNQKEFGLKILSCGSGMQSSALALMSCENAVHPNTYPLVPVYDAIIFCDLGNEPEWVYSQTKFIAQECEKVDIGFYILESPLYKDLIENYGKKRVVSVPYWKINEDGKKSKMPRNCTLDYKINLIAKFVRWNLLGYKKGQHLLTKDIKSHEMHIGFSYEERHRCRENPLKLFVNKFPLVEMQLERKDNYAYIKDVWGLETKASACNICPFHRNYFFLYLKQHHKSDYDSIIKFDEILEKETKNTKVKGEVYISRSRKRIKNLSSLECNDAETFLYKGTKIWNGF